MVCNRGKRSAEEPEETSGIVLMLYKIHIKSKNIIVYICIVLYALLQLSFSDDFYTTVYRPYDESDYGKTISFNNEWHDYDSPLEKFPQLIYRLKSLQVSYS